MKNTQLTGRIVRHKKGGGEYRVLEDAAIIETPTEAAVTASERRFRELLAKRYVPLPSVKSSEASDA